MIEQQVNDVPFRPHNEAVGQVNLYKCLHLKLSELIGGIYTNSYANLLRAYAKNAFEILRLQTSSDSIR